ncbi:2-hydroxyacid dehydrogenase [Orrella sp. JC864]|uniref:2-hydroxyacid dehydrogenase n=1 Tax=Orrella sp. JC864 TaxID=3120298 RepID=UPI00300B49B7
MSQIAELWMPGPLAPALSEAIAQRYRVHQGWTVDDVPAYLREHGPRIRAIATSGRHGADRALIESLPALEAIISYGVGYDPIDVQAAHERGVAVSNTPGVLDACVADTALALLLAVSRRVCEADRFVRAGRWPSEGFGLGASLAGKRCGILGLGNIGLQIARRAEAFGMQVLYANRQPRPDAPAHYGYRPDAASLAQDSDWLVVAVPGGAGTRHLVDAGVLQALGPQGRLVNVARGSVVDEAALVQALQQGTIAGAGLDVFEHEPQVPAALMEMEQVVLLPHIASGTHETRQAMAELFLRNLHGWFERRELATPVPQGSGAPARAALSP